MGWVVTEAAGADRHTQVRDAGARLGPSGATKTHTLGLEPYKTRTVREAACAVDRLWTYVRQTARAATLGRSPFLDAVIRRIEGAITILVAARFKGRAGIRAAGDLDTQEDTINGPIVAFIPRQLLTATVLRAARAWGTRIGVTDAVRNPNNPRIGARLFRANGAKSPLIAAGSSGRR